MTPFFAGRGGVASYPMGHILNQGLTLVEGNHPDPLLGLYKGLTLALCSD